jgi:soluble lytic murein transglycosylase
MSQVPATLLARVQQIAPDKYDDLVKFGRTISRGENNSDPATYLTLVSHPDMLAALSDADMLQLKTQLSNGDWDRFAKEREQLRIGQIDTGPQSINTAAVNTSLNNHLLSIGIEPTPGKSDMKGQQQVGAIQKFIRDGIFAQQAQTGQKMTPEQIDHFVDQQFAKSVTFRNTFLGFDTTKESVPLLGMKIGDVPAADRAQITEALQAKGVAVPTAQDVLNMYWRRKARGG